MSSADGATVRKIRIQELLTYIHSNTPFLPQLKRWCVLRFGFTDATTNGYLRQLKDCNLITLDKRQRVKTTAYYTPIS